MKVDRISNWKKFSKHMEEYLENRVLKKYYSEDKELDILDLIDERICVFCIMKYAFRIWNGCGKEHDFEKIAHYAEIAWTKKRGKA